MFDFPKTIKIFTSRVMRNLALVLSGDIFAAGLGFLAVLIISKSLSVSDFGLFNLAISVILIISHLASLGTSTSMIKFVSSYLAQDKSSEAVRVLKIVMVTRIITGAAAAFAVLITAQPVAEKLFHLPQLTSLLKIAASGIFFVAVYDYIRSALYSYKMFKEYVSTQIMVDLAKILAVFVLLISLNLTRNTAVGIFAIIPALGIVIGFIKIQNILSSPEKPVKHLLSRLVSYSKWTFLTIASRSATPYISIFIIAKMLDTRTVGIYGLALNLTYIFPILIKSLGSVLLPEVSRFREIHQFESYIGKTLKASFFMFAGILPVLFFSGKIIVFFFGARYADSVVIFNWLMVGFIFQVSSTTVQSALYSLHKPHVVAAADLLSLFLMITGCIIFIPPMGPVAPAVLTVVINAAGLIFLTFYALIHVRAKRHNQKLSPGI